MKLALDLLPDRLAICRLPCDGPGPDWPTGDLVSITRTGTELSVVCDESSVPPGIRTERGWRALRVRGPLSFDLVGVIASISGTLAFAGTPAFVISTFDTDYVLVTSADLGRSVTALRSAGHDVVEPS